MPSMNCLKNHHLDRSCCSKFCPGIFMAVFQVVGHRLYEDMRQICSYLCNVHCATSISIFLEFVIVSVAKNYVSVYHKF